MSVTSMFLRFWRWTTALPMGRSQPAPRLEVNKREPSIRPNNFMGGLVLFIDGRIWGRI